MDNQIKFRITNIIGEPMPSKNGDGTMFTRVNIDSDTFRMLRGANPSIPFKKIGAINSDESVRKFNINGVELYSIYNRNTFKNYFVANLNDAKKNLVSTDELIATNEMAMPFDNALLDRNLVASA